MEAGEGTIPVSARSLYQSIQTWDGILGGERLLTMSCSDKLCRWNFIGLQGNDSVLTFGSIDYRSSSGALLSQLIQPIYYTSIIIGSLYHSEHIRRALFARIEHVRLFFSFVALTAHQTMFRLPQTFRRHMVSVDH